jgi:hypothetical protein
VTPEIRAFEYALGLFAVLIGLAVADVANSFHRLARHTVAVVWDPLALLAALYALCLTVGMWFDLWGVRHFAETRHFFFYLWMLADLFVLFAASLPDSPAQTSDLREHYARGRRYFWTLVLIFQVSYLLNGVYFVGPDLWRHFSYRTGSMFLVNMVLPGVVALVLLLKPSRQLHYIGIVALFLLLAVHYAPYQIN